MPASRKLLLGGSTISGIGVGIDSIATGVSAGAKSLIMSSILTLV